MLDMRPARSYARTTPQNLTKHYYKRRNEVERTIHRLKGFRVVATRYAPTSSTAPSPSHQSDNDPPCRT